MVKSILATIAFGVSVDKETNNLSIFNQLEQINPTKLPGVLPEFVLIGIFQREPSDLNDVAFHVKFICPSGKIQEIGSFKMHFKGSERTRIFVKMNGFAISEYGKHSFRIEWPDGVFDVELNVKEEIASAKLIK